MKKKSAAFYSPYWNIYGGGERYLLQIAEKLDEYQLYFIAPDNLKKKAKEFFGLNLRGKVIEPAALAGHDTAKRFKLLNRFDLFFYTTDGSLFFPFSRRNYLIIQSPKHIPENTFYNRLKLLNWRIICYSQFMKKIVDRNLKTQSTVLPPVVDTEIFSYREEKKENLILSVGRFFLGDMHEKRQDFLIDFFSNNRRSLAGWRLVLAGNVSEESSQKYLEKLRAKIIDLPVSIYANLNFNDLLSFYQKAKIYWHAAGYGQDLINHPQKAEHFGITTLEAMASGCVPIVFKAGGQLDIIREGINGWFWEDEETLLQKTVQLASDESGRQDFAERSLKRAEFFSVNNYKEKINEILKK